ncbi:MAG TPA: transcriptional repressor LexA [Candidatus Polarisedimenticolaceae bacterium]|nr:transcriptional repressor LexA [Candidatus Polarisedimenticolaceae bacterium]
MALTRRQRQVLDVIRDFIDTHGYSPSLEEIGSELHLSSVATVHKHVSHLVQKGFVKRAWNQNRSIELVHQAPAAASVQLRLAGRIAAGHPLEAVETDEAIAVPADMVRDVDNAYVLRVQGDSMINEQIRDGDFVVVERRAAAQDGETIVALIEGADATLKRLFREGPNVRLQPANPQVEPIVVPAERLRIQGVVVGVIRKY